LNLIFAMPRLAPTPEPRVLQTLDYPRQLWCVLYSCDGETLYAAGYDAHIARWDLREEKPQTLDPLSGHRGWVQRLALVDKLLISGDSWGCLIAWKDAAGEAEPAWKIDAALSGWIRDLAVSPDQSLVAVAGNDSAVKLYEVQTGKLISELPEHPADVMAIAYHPQGKTLVTGDLLGTIRCWDLENKKVTRTIEAPSLCKLDRIQDCGGVRRLVFDPLGKQLLVCGMKDPTGGFAVGPPLGLLLNWESGKVAQELQTGDKNQGFLYDAIFHPNGYIIGTSCAMPSTGYVWCWQPGEAEPFSIGKKLVNGRSLSLHPEGKHVALATVISGNGNGRPKDKAYVDGFGKMQLVELPERMKA
jgi:WD40 repeat protein